MGNYDHLLSPLEIRGKVYRNRMLAGPTGFARFLTEIFIEGTNEMLEERAAGGQASVCVGENPVSYAHDPTDNKTGEPSRKFNMRDTDGPDFYTLKAAAELIKKHGALAFMELSHPGNSGTPDRVFPDIYGPVAFTREDGVEVKAFDRESMDRTIDDFVKAALFMKKAGYDGVLIHGGHGFLFTQFFSPRTNTRTDEYGGESIKDRARFPLEILKAVREAVGGDFIIELRISGAERMENGVTAEMMAEFSTMLSGLVDILHVSSGHYFHSYRTRELSSHFHPHACNLDLAKVISAAAPPDVHVALIGGINSPEQSEELIRDGYVDFVIFGRQMFADPEFANKVAAGHPEDIQRCVRCMRCYKGSVEHPDEIAYLEKHPLKPGPIDPRAAFCTVNPASGGFLFPGFHIKKADIKKKVLVIGGGVAGMTAAITAADEGHEVVLAEKTGRLGGILWFLDNEESKEDLKNFRDLLIRRVEGRDIKVMLNTPVSSGLIRQFAPDAVLIAVGASAAVPPIPGIEKAIPALEVYKDTCSPGKKIVIVGGGMVGCDTAIYLAEKGHDVTIVEMQERIALEMAFMQFTAVADRLTELGVDHLVNTRCKEIKDNSVVLEGADGSFELNCDSVIFSLGMKSRKDEAKRIEQMIPAGVKTVLIGDVNSVARVGDAGKAGFLAAMEI